MMHHRIIVIATVFLNLSYGFTYGQSDSIVFLAPKSSYYSATDFSQVDSLGLWFYVLLDKNLSYEDSIKPVGQLIIQRETVTRNWAPNFVFQIFDIKDSSYCFKKSKSVRIISSCVPPNVAGDIIVVGKYIFLDTHVCLQCKNEDNGRDYCRPVINKIFSKIDFAKTSSLTQIVEQLPIKGQSIKIPF